MASADQVTREAKINAQFSREWVAVLECFEMMTIALGAHGHTWTDQEHEIYHRAVRTLKRLLEVSA